jgi:hypothetical protein
MGWGEHSKNALRDLDVLREAVIEYLNELDNPAPDPTMRTIRRDRLRQLVNVPKP